MNQTPSSSAKPETAKHTLSLKDFESLETLRGEVEHRAHLIKEELKGKYTELEQEWTKLNSQFQTVRTTATAASHEVSEATQLLVETVRDGYTKIKKSLA